MARRKGAGRPSILTPELTEKVGLFVRSGATIETACAAAGIHKDTLYTWMKKAAVDRNRGKTTPETVFTDAVEQGLAIADIRDIAYIEAAASRGDWRAAAWRLSRRNRAEWGTTWDRRDSVDEQDDAGPSLVDGLASFLAAAFTRPANGQARGALPPALGDGSRGVPAGRVRDGGVEEAGGDHDGPDDPQEGGGA